MRDRLDPEKFEGELKSPIQGRYYSSSFTTKVRSKTDENSSLVTPSKGWSSERITVVGAIAGLGVTPEGRGGGGKPVSAVVEVKGLSQAHLDHQLRRIARISSSVTPTRGRHGQLGEEDIIPEEA